MFQPVTQPDDVGARCVRSRRSREPLPAKTARARPRAQREATPVDSTRLLVVIPGRILVDANGKLTGAEGITSPKVVVIGVNPNLISKFRNGTLGGSVEVPQAARIGSRQGRQQFAREFPLGDRRVLQQRKLCDRA